MMKGRMGRLIKQRAWFIILIVLVFGVFLGNFVDLHGLFADWNVYHTIALISATTAVIMLIWKATEAKKMTLRPNITAERFEGLRYLFTMSIENLGNVTIYPERVYLFVDEGVFDEGKCFYDFPFLLEHIDGADNCTLKSCCLEPSVRYPEASVDQRFQGKFKKCYEIKGLSLKVIQYISPGELFRDNIIIDFPNEGAYRAHLVIIGKEANPCCCTSVQVYVASS